MSITDKRLTEIQARVEDATEGPWYVEYESEECPPFKPYAYAIHGPTMQGVLESQVSDDFKAQYGHQMDEVAGVAAADAELIAHAPTDLADLLAEVERLRDELAKAREVTREKMDDATYAVASVHHPFSSGCLCGYKSARKRDVTEHILDQFIAALGGGDDA